MHSLSRLLGFAPLLPCVLGAQAALTRFDEWREDSFAAEELSDQAVSGPFAAPLGDGIPNLMKYAQRRELGETAMPLEPAFGGESPAGLLYRRDPAIRDASLRLETAGNLDSWQEVTRETATVWITWDNEGFEQVEIPLPESGAIFARLTVAEQEVPRMQLGTNFWNFRWGTGRGDYFKTGVNWNSVEDLWRPEFLDDIAIYRVIRWMDQVPTNHSGVRNWSQRVSKTENHYETDGGAVAYEWQIDLCNRVGADYWITVPHRTVETYETNPEQNYWSELAALVREQLDPSLKVYVEYSNETWNSGFGQGTYAASRGTEMGFNDDPYTARFFYQVYAATRLHKVFLDEFAGEHDRLRLVVSGQAASAWGTRSIVMALQNRTFGGPDERLNPFNLRPHHLALASYIQTSHAAAASIRQDWADALDEEVFDLERHLELMRGSGLRLVAYEGGQHYTSNASAFSVNPESYDMYGEWLEAIAPFHELLMHYTHTGTWSGGGAWGAKASTGQSISDAHRYRALRDWVQAQ